MPIHDWTRVPVSIFHAFRHGWISQVAGSLNSGLLVGDYYALPEKVAGGFGKAVTIRRVRHHELVGIVQIVSPANKDNVIGLNAFSRKTRDVLAAGIHLLILDLFPPGPLDPQGIHRAIWGENCGEDYAVSADKPLAGMAYLGGEAGGIGFIEPLAVGDALPDMPLSVGAGDCLQVRLEATYQEAWKSFPVFWKNILIADVAS